MDGRVKPYVGAPVGGQVAMDAGEAGHAASPRPHRVQAGLGERLRAAATGAPAKAATVLGRQATLPGPVARFSSARQLSTQNTQSPPKRSAPAAAMEAAAQGPAAANDAAAHDGRSDGTAKLRTPGHGDAVAKSAPMELESSANLGATRGLTALAQAAQLRAGRQQTTAMERAFQRPLAAADPSGRPRLSGGVTVGARPPHMMGRRR